MLLLTARRFFFSFIRTSSILLNHSPHSVGLGREILSLVSVVERDLDCMIE